MKTILIASFITFSTLGVSFASCEGNYLDYLKGAQEREEGRREFRSKYGDFQAYGFGVGAIVGSQLTAKAALSSIAGDSAIVSTAAVPGFLLGGYLGVATSVKILDKKLEGDRSASEADKIQILTGALRLLKESQAGQGTNIQSFMPLVWSQVNSKIALSDLTEAVNTLNSENAFCQSNDELDSSIGIIKKSIEVLKTKN